MTDAKQTIFGIHPVEMLLKSPIKIEKILILESLQKNKLDFFKKKAFEKKIPIETASNRKIMDDICPDDAHQGIIAFVKTEVQYLPLESLKEAKTILILDHITDARNFGAIIRSADLFSVDALVIPEDRSVHINPTVIKASAGTAFFMKIIKVPNLSNAILKLKDWGFWIYGSVGEGGEDLFKTPLSEKTAIVLGSEGKGIAEKILEKCDFKISIPTEGNIDSLNVSVATGIILYDLSIKRRKVQG